jgi:hypothetical protein
MSVYEATVLGRFGRVPPATWSASQMSSHFPTVSRRSAGAWPSSAARMAALTASRHACLVDPFGMVIACRRPSAPV